MLAEVRGCDGFEGEVCMKYMLIFGVCIYRRDGWRVQLWAPLCLCEVLFRL